MWLFSSHPALEQISSAVAPMKYLKRGSSQGKPPETQLSSRVFESETWKGNGCFPDGFKGVHLDIQKGKKAPLK